MAEKLFDHFVLPVADLGVARERLSALGFSVAPDGVHPFGTANACVYLSDATFLEALTVADPGLAAQAVKDGNVFVGRDAQFRRLAGDSGFSAVVLKTDDAQADDAVYRRDGISAGAVLDFERPAKDADGKADIAAFRLAFAADPASPAPYFFTCQRVRSPKIDRSALERHDNGATRLLGVEARAVDPQSHATFLNDFLGAAPASGLAGLTWSLGNGDFALVHEAGAYDDGMHLAKIRFAVADLDATRRLFKDRGIAYEVDGNSLIVPPAPGQGATFSFEALA